MSLTKDEIIYLADSCKKDFDVLKKWTNLSAMSLNEALENLENLIAFKISKLIENDQKSLLDLLYATDIGESKVKECYQPDKTSSEIARDLAKLYIYRMMQKWKTRQEYASKDIEGDWD